MCPEWLDEQQQGWPCRDVLLDWDRPAVQASAPDAVHIRDTAPSQPALTATLTSCEAFGLEDVAVADLAQQAHAAIVAGRWDALRPLLHPYIHWTDVNGTVRGRSKVMAMLARAATAPAEPGSIEVRDGQIYRWHS